MTIMNFEQFILCEGVEDFEINDDGTVTDKNRNWCGQEM